MRLAGKIATMARRGAPLPYDAEVEYIKTTGTQWIDSGVIVNGDDVHFNIRFRTSHDFVYYSPICYAGFWSDSNSYGCQLVSVNANYVRHSYKTRTQTIVNRDVERLYSNRRFTVDFNSGVNNSGRMYVLGRSNTDENICDLVPNEIGLESFSAKGDDGVYIVDFVSVRFTNENGVSEGAMYDRVSGKLFRNSGTGAFIIGPDKISAEGGGTKCLTPRRSYRRLARPSARFCARSTSQRWEVAA